MNGLKSVRDDTKKDSMGEKLEIPESIIMRWAKLKRVWVFVTLLIGGYWTAQPYAEKVVGHLAKPEIEKQIEQSFQSLAELIILIPGVEEAANKKAKDKKLSKLVLDVLNKK